MTEHKFCILKRENRQISCLTEQGKREHRFYLFFTSLCFLFGAYALWAFMYDLCNMIGSIVSGTPVQALIQFLRVMPRVLTAFAVVFMCSSAHQALRAKTEISRVRSWHTAGIASCIFGLAIVGYIVVGLCSGQYEKLVEGYVTPLFPLDSLLMGVFFLAQGVILFLYAERLRKDGTHLPLCETTPCLAVCAVRCIFYAIVGTAAECGLAACVYGLFTMRWNEGGIFFNCALLLNYFAAFAMVVLYRFVYLETVEQKKKQVQIRLSFAILLVNAVLFGLYFAALSLDLGAPNRNAFSVLPIEYTASVHAFALIYGAVNLLSPLVALVKGLLQKDKKD